MLSGDQAASPLHDTESFSSPLPQHHHTREGEHCLVREIMTYRGRVRRLATYVPDLRFGGRRLLATTARIPVHRPFFFWLQTTTPHHTTPHLAPPSTLYGSLLINDLAQARVKGVVSQRLAQVGTYQTRALAHIPIPTPSKKRNIVS